jgi:hypothetical protein
MIIVMIAVPRAVAVISVRLPVVISVIAITVVTMIIVMISMATTFGRIRVAGPARVAMVIGMYIVVCSRIGMRHVRM